MGATESWESCSRPRKIETIKLLAPEIGPGGALIATPESDPPESGAKDGGPLAARARARALGSRPTQDPGTAPAQRAPGADVQRSARRRARFRELTA